MSYIRKSIRLKDYDYKDLSNNQTLGSNIDEIFGIDRKQLRRDYSLEFYL